MYLHARAYLIGDRCQVDLYTMLAGRGNDLHDVASVWHANAAYPRRLDNAPELEILLEGLIGGAVAALNERRNIRELRQPDSPC